ncbi:chloride channel protein [Leptospira yasudae]|uniref:Chloride channel protein n=1 Tax=Leptospira yasudae TaxID=2202201 RepID=A0A6N4QIA3_9LEPT|nr:chloride channel protein [Leptospira yasudae]TGL73678.1 chloride channel protein [Leptospira yasudae]TGL78817.1 chloride channel protein [Leptospira yasudae]TGL83457.1 chloride channel protein [Leptospira yasudae]
MKTETVKQPIFRISGRRSLYFYCILTGIVSGLGAFVFSRILAVCEYLFLERAAGLSLPHASGEFLIDSNDVLHWGIPFSDEYRPWLLFFLPIIGGLLTGWIVNRFSPESGGTGSDAMIDSFHNQEGRMNPVVSLIKSIATVFTLASGGSGGKEGPISQIGAGFGSLLATLLKAGARARRTLLLAGTAGGLGAIFHAPLGGALTSVEMIYREDIESDSLIPCIISSVSAYLVYCALNGFNTVYRVADTEFSRYTDLIFYLGLGVLCFLCGDAFIRFFRKVQNFSIRLKISPIIKPALGGIVIGTVGLFLPETIGTGAGVLQVALDGKDPVGTQGIFSSMFQTTGLWLVALFFILAGMKILTTSFTIGTGGSAGMFGPSLFIGGMLGGGVGTLAKVLVYPDLSVASFILVGMGAFYAGVASAPIAGMIMICEMIGSYTLLPPLMVVSILTFVLSHKLSLYRAQKETRFQSPAHFWDMNRDFLEEIQVRSCRNRLRTIAVAQEHRLLSELEEEALKIQASDYVIVNQDNRYLGILSLRKARHTLESRNVAGNLITVGDVTDTSAPSGTLDDSLASLLKNLIDQDLDKIAIVDEDRFIGYLRFADLMKIYFENTFPKSAKSVPSVPKNET